MKKCNRCVVEKSFDSFHKDRTTKDGFYSVCKLCKKEYTYKKYWSNPEKYKIARKVAYLNNPHKEREQSKLRSRKWRKENIGHHNFLTKTYKADKIKATPKWANFERIKALYQLAAMLNKNTDQKWHVDHIVPLRHPKVCGLHTYENLRVITAEENMKKHNTFEVA